MDDEKIIIYIKKWASKSSKWKIKLCKQFKELIWTI